MGSLRCCPPLLLTSASLKTVQGQLWNKSKPKSYSETLSIEQLTCSFVSASSLSPPLTALPPPLSCHFSDFNFGFVGPRWDNAERAEINIYIYLPVTVIESTFVVPSQPVVLPGLFQLFLSAARVIWSSPSDCTGSCCVIS